MVNSLPGNPGAPQNTFSFETEWVAMVKWNLSLNKPGPHNRKHTHTHIHLDVLGVGYAKMNTVLNWILDRVIFNIFKVEVVM